MNKVFAYHVETVSEEEKLTADRGLVFASNLTEATEKVFKAFSFPIEEVVHIEVCEADMEEDDLIFSAYCLLSDWNISKEALQHELKSWYLI